MVKIEISQELYDRLADEKKEFEKSINIEFNIEQTIWEILKIANYNNTREVHTS